eukprot:348147-Pleurochrysis_carterae.AAC.1
MPSEPAGSSRVTRSQSRARAAAGLPPATVEPLPAVPAQNPRSAGKERAPSAAPPAFACTLGASVPSSRSSSSGWQAADSDRSESPATRALLGYSPEMYASDNAASSAFHAAVSAPPRVPTPEPVSRVVLDLTPYPGRVRVFAYVFTSTPRPDRDYWAALHSSSPPSPPASERSYTGPTPDPSSLSPPPMPPSLPP